MKHRTVEIPFVGGPFDGHKQSFTDPPIIEHLALPVNENMLPLLEGKKPGPPSSTSTLARYELRKAEGGWQYHFVEAVAAGDIYLDAFRRQARKVAKDDKAESP